MIPNRLPIRTLLLAAVLLAAAGARAATEAPAFPVPDTIETENIPPLPLKRAEALRPYSHIRGADFQGWHPSERRMLITTRFGEVSQVHEVAMPLGARTQLTFFDERASGAAYRPGNPDQIVFSLDEGGAENYQLFVLDRATGRTQRFTDGVHRYGGARWSNRGKRLAYISNARNGVDFDLYVADPAVAGSERRVAELKGQWFPLDWSPDDSRLAVMHYVSVNETHLWTIAVADGARRRLTPEGERTAWGGARWTPDGRSIYTTTDRDGEFHRLVRLDVDSGQWKPAVEGLNWDVEAFDVSDDGSLLAYAVNADGMSELHFLDLAAGRKVAGPELPPGVIRGLEFRPGSREIAYVLSWARSPNDVYSFKPASGAGAAAPEPVRWTASEVGGLPIERFSVPKLVRFPTFDEAAPGERRTIPAFVILPDPARHPPPWPVYVDIHGGPEGQERPGFLGSTNYLIEALGVAVITPNVRGSSGYGKSYLLLDNGRLREDSVRDIGALLDWIAGREDLDASRVMVGGASYGGYMTLASLTHFGERLRCGFDYVGVSNFVTFLENTQDYRRHLRRAEYGDESDPEMRAFLESISPANRVDKITVPLLVAQGANDPRVPLSESDQVVEAVAARGTPVWYLVAADEGHGFAKKSNADYLRIAWIEFLDRCLLGEGFARPAGAAAR